MHGCRFSVIECIFNFFSQIGPKLTLGPNYQFNERGVMAFKFVGIESRMWVIVVQHLSSGDALIERSLRHSISF